jgi:O-antigen ligase
MLSRLGIESRLQLLVTLCVMSLIVVTTLGGSGGAPWVFFTYRTLLVLTTVLSVIGSRKTEDRVSPLFLGLAGLVLALMLISVLRIRGSHFEGFYLWYKYLFFACAFLSLANYSRLQSARWKALLLGTVVAIGLAHLVPDLLRWQPVYGFSRQNSNYFGTFLLICLAAALSTAVFGVERVWRAVAGLLAVVTLLGIFKTTSRGATLAAAGMIVLAAIRGRGRISRQVWLGIGLAGLLTAMIASPFLIRKFMDRGDIDPYNYARKEIWLGSIHVIAQNPVLGVGFGQFFHVSKRFTLPVEGAVARYLKRAQMAHSEYLQHMAEQGIPATLLLLSLFAYMAFLAWKRAEKTFPEYRMFQEAAILTAFGVGAHGLVDNCWTIPVTTSSLIVLSLADLMPLRKKERQLKLSAMGVALAGVAVGLIYLVSTAIPALGLYYNDLGHQAYDRNDFAAAERLHLKAIRFVPDHPLFLDNLGMVYLQASIDLKQPQLIQNAGTYFERAIDASPQSLDPHIHMETLLIRELSGDPTRDAPVYKDILKYDTELLQIDPFIPFVRKNLGSAYYNLGNPEEGFKQLSTAIGYEPNYVPGYLQMATWYGERGDNDSNRKYTAAALTIINKYKAFKPTEGYEVVLLGRPPQAK